MGWYLYHDKPGQKHEHQKEHLPYIRISSEHANQTYKYMQYFIRNAVFLDWYVIISQKNLFQITKIIGKFNMDFINSMQIKTYLL